MLEWKKVDLQMVMEMVVRVQTQKNNSIETFSEALAKIEALESEMKLLN